MEEMWMLLGGLFLILQCSSAVEITEKRVVAEGSSVLLHAPDVKNINLTEWEYIKDTTPVFILQYYADSQSPTIYPTYQGRVVFYPNNSSLLLQKLQETDSGVYKATIDLMEDKASITFLEVIKTVPQPKIQGSSGLVGSPIRLFCMLPQGRVDDISWKKDGCPLPPERFYHLYENGTILQIEKGERADCGSYSCNVSNAVSWKEAQLNVTVVGLPPLLHHAQRMAAAALVFVVGSAVTFIVLLCQPQKQLGKKVRRWMAVFIQVLVCVSSLFLLTTTSIWMQQEGVSAAFVLLCLFLFATVVTTALLAATLLCRPAAFNQFKTKRWLRVTLDAATPTAVIVLLLFTSLMLQNIQQLHERGCSEPISLTLSFTLAAAVVLSAMVAFFLWSYKRKGEKRKMENVQVTHDAHGTTDLQA